MKHAIAVCIAAALLTGIPSALQAQKLTKEQKDILELQNTRSLGNGRLISYLQSPDKDLRYRAAIALGNLQDTSTASPLIPLLGDPEEQVRAAAAFALGQIGSSTAVKALTNALRADQDVQVLSQIFEGLGKCGDREALNAVVAYVPSARNITLKRDQALSIARFALRRMISERGVWLCFDLLKDHGSETRSAALYALWRSAPLKTIDAEITNRAYVLVKLMSDRDADVRINLAALLGKTKSDEAPKLIRMFQEAEGQDPDWRVQVQLARSIASQAKANPGLIGILLSYLDSQNDHVMISALTALATIDPSALAETAFGGRIESRINELATVPTKRAILIQGEAIVALGRLYPERLSKCRSKFESESIDNILRAKYVEALSYQPTEQNMRYVLGRLTDDSVRVAMAAWEYLANMVRAKQLASATRDSAFADSLPSLIVGNAERALERKDLAITTLVADLFTDSSVFSRCRRAGLGSRIVKNLDAAYSHLTSTNDAEAMLAIQRAFVGLQDSSVVNSLEKTLHDPNHSIALGAAETLLKLTGRDYRGSVPPEVIAPPTENDWAALEAIRPGQRISFRTTKGTFTIRLRKDDAPFTVLAFYRLVKEKFYNGLTFHRVVPDFVIQGGDPRGDGWGGPGFTLRSEFSMASFVRGSVGMASSGKDTEGCQFFITHVATPHLDGRYTLFASVVWGMQVVDRIEVGDKILNAWIR